MIETEYRAIVAIISTINNAQYPLEYMGIADLTECGTCKVRVILPEGVKAFEHVPCFIYVDVRDALAVNVRNILPKLVIKDYQEV